MVFYNVFVAFVGLNNNTILAMQNIEFGTVSSDRYPDPTENASIEAIRSWISDRHTASMYIYIYECVCVCVCVYIYIWVETKKKRVVL